MSVVRRGEDKQITFTLVDDSGVDINLATAYTGIICILVTDDREILARYSREAYTDVNGNVFDVADFAQSNQTTNTGEFVIRLQRDITSVAPLVKFKWEIKVQAADADYDSSTFDTLAIVDSDSTNVRFEFKDAVSKNDQNYA